MIKHVASFLLLFSLCSVAADDTLSIDKMVPQTEVFAFANDANVQPELGDFEVNNTVLMSNEKGERFAVVTISNLASGRRTITEKHLLALLANGTRIAPEAFQQPMLGQQTLSLTVAFGEHKFPILQVYSRTRG